ncbi:MAG: SDR family oxidoreductase [Chitinophagia bacterium]|nr:SDR family oxidoreductase [Chitinophagia bacterium]
MATFLVVGGSSGIGLQVTNQLALAGHTVHATYNTNTEVATTSNIHYHALNVLDENINLDFLPASIEGIVYCPGAISLRPFNRIPTDDFIKDYTLQVVGAIKVIQAALPKLKESKNGSIVLFSTVAVQLGLNFHSLVASSKGAIEGLTKALSAELAPSIRVNCIAPSLTNTPLAASLLNSDQKMDANAQRHPLKRVGTPVDIANAVEFLLTDKSSWVTGQILSIDGGMSTIKL